MDMNLLHDITFYVMYAAMAIAFFIPTGSASRLASSR